MELRPHFWAGENHLIPGKMIQREQWWIKWRKEREARGRAWRTPPGAENKETLCWAERGGLAPSQGVCPAFVSNKGAN